MKKGTVALLPFVLICILSNLCLLLSSADASESILSFHSDITVHQDSSMIVRETIRVMAEGQKIKRGIYRDFPVSYKDRYGNRYIVGFTVIEVLRNGLKEPYHVTDISNGKRVYIGDKKIFLPKGEYTYTLTYKTTRQLGFFKEHDELYWNVTGNDWEFPIKNASASVHLPGDAQSSIISAEAYTGPYGAKGKDYDRSVGSGGAVIYTTKPLKAYEGLTIVVAWPKGFVAEPDTARKLKYFLSDNRGVFLGLSGLAVILLYYFFVWTEAGRDPEKGVIMTRYSPPENMTPAIMRYIKKMGYDDRTFASAVINMAVKGRIKIIENDGEYTLQKKDGGSTPLSHEEERIMENLLSPAKSITLKTANHSKIKSAIESLQNHLKVKCEKIYFITNKRYFITGLSITIVALILSGLWEAAARGRTGEFIFMCLWLSIWSIAVFALISLVIARWKKTIRSSGRGIADAVGALFITLFSIPFVIGEFVGLYFMGQAASVLMMFFLPISAFVNYLFYHLLKAPTRAGRRLLDSIDGFRVFLTATEKDRLNMLNPPEKTPELFEKYLPYALALDVEQEWAEQFSDVLSGAAAGREEAVYSPVWFSGTSLSSMTAGDFASSLSSAFAGAVSSSSTAPGSSSGGGGGGSSGGGGGGGGGGGW